MYKLLIVAAPFHKGIDDGHKALTQLAERVFGADGRLGDDGARDKACGIHFLKVGRKYLLANAGDSAIQRVEAHRMVYELLDDIDLLLVVKELKARGNRAGRQFFFGKHGDSSIVWTAFIIAAAVACGYYLPFGNWLIDWCLLLVVARFLHDAYRRNERQKLDGFAQPSSTERKCHVRES